MSWPARSPATTGWSRTWSSALSILGLSSAILAGACSRSSEHTPPPNVVFVFADDLGYGDLGSYGSSTIATPELDRLAQEGARFTQFYVGASVCTPSRAALLTGRYPSRMTFDPRGVYFPDSRGGLDPAEITIAEILRERGYATALIGKWHLGHLPDFLPRRQGFDLFYGLPYSNDMDEPQYPGVPPPVRTCISLRPDCPEGVPLMENETVLEMPAHQATLTQRYTERAVDFIRDAVAQERPFFLYYASNFPHVPLYASDAFIGRSRDGLYGDVVEELDASVGTILRELQALGVDDNTLVLFSSDNGPWLLWSTDAPVVEGGQDSGTAGPLRQGKSTTFEGGMRVPMIAHWPGRIPPRVVDEPATMMDWLPTLAAWAGAALPADRPLDGADLTAVLEGRAARDPEQPFRFLYHRQDGSGLAGYREGRWKLKLAVRGGESLYSRYDHDDLLFDLEADPSEEVDLAATMPARVAEMKARMNELAAAIDE